MSDLPVLEADLHLYVDNGCSPELGARVEAYLATHPEAAERVANWKSQNAALRDMFPIPPINPSLRTLPSSGEKEKSAALLRYLTFLLVFLLGVTLTIIVSTGFSIFRPDMSSIRALIYSIFLRG